MRTLSTTLTRAQKAQFIAHKNLLIKCVLTYGTNTYTYTKTKLRQVRHNEQVFSHNAVVLVDDTDKTMHNLNLEGYKAYMSYGLITPAGEEWVPTAPMWVVGQDRDSHRTKLECLLELEGIFNRMGKHKAEDTYTQEDDDTNTVKDLLIAIAQADLAPYTGYPHYTIIFDSEDDLIDSFIPADSFRINVNDTRKAKFKELLQYTDCVARIGNDEAIHILNPTTSGSSYDYQYDRTKGVDYHNFFNKRFRRRIVSPNYIVYKNLKSLDTPYEGYAKDDSADLDYMKEIETHYVRATSSAQCTNLAVARLLKYQLASEKGSGVIPFMNFGQEIYDYINFNDAIAGDNRAGNVGHLSRFYDPLQFGMNLGFGRAPLGVPALEGLATGAGQGLTIENLMPLFDSLYSYVEQILDILGDKVDIDDLNNILLALYEDAYFRRLTVTHRLRIPHSASTPMYGD